MADISDDLPASGQEASGTAPRPRPVPPAPSAGVPAPQEPQSELPPTDDEAALTSVTQASEAAVADALAPVLDVEASLAAFRRRLAVRQTQVHSTSQRTGQGVAPTFLPVPRESSREMAGHLVQSAAAVSTAHRVPVMAGAAAIDFVWLSDDLEWLQLISELSAEHAPEDPPTVLEATAAPKTAPAKPDRDAPDTAGAGTIQELLPMVFANPDKALAQARGVLASDPPPWNASVAHQVIGIWQRDWGNMRSALHHLHRACDLAAHAQEPDREADTLAALGVALVHAGRTEEGMEALDRAVERGTGRIRARVLFRRAYAGWVLGRHREALEDIRRAIPVLRQAYDVIWTARALTLRATVHLALGSVERADADFAAAEALWDTTGQDYDHDKADVVESRGLAAFRSGDLPAALRLLDEAKERYARLGTPPFMLSIRRCEVLMAAGLAPEALAEADATIGMLEDMGGHATRKAELLLVAARAARLAGDPHTAIARAALAVRLFGRQHRHWWAAHARLVLIEARVASGRRSGRLVADAAAVADQLASFGAPAAPEASLLAGRIALALGWTADAERHLAVVARSRRSGPPLARMTGWTAQALRAQAAGSGRGVLEACRRGLDVLDDHRLTLGASELRARATARGAELAELAQHVSLAAGSPRRLLTWSERGRATMLFIPPARPPADPVLQSSLTAFREIAARAEAARSDGRPIPALEREQRLLERDIRSHTLHLRGDAAHDAARFDPGRLLQELGDDTCLAELTVVDGRLQVLLCGQGRVRRFEAGRLADAEAEAQHVKAGLRRLAHLGAQASLPMVEEAGRRLEELLLGPAAVHLGSRPLVVVPPGQLHRVPWALLPSLRERVLSVSPSASSWLRARETVPPPGGRHVLVRGPGLSTGGAEVPELADRYGRSTLLEHDDARVPRVLDELDGAALAHIAAHGAFRADSPLFSSLRMADGPLIAHDFEGLDRSPYRIILSGNDTAHLASVGADELLGLATALLPLGTAGMVASSAPVHDAAVVPLMLALHEGLAAGRPLAEALRDARVALPDDAAHRATGWAFTAFGAA